MHATAIFPAGRLAGFAILVLAAACDEVPGTREDAAPAVSAGGPGCAPGAFVATTLYGAVEVDIEWRGEALACEGMPRPDGAGARLRFSGPATGDRSVTIIIALPELAPGSAAGELGSNVTLIEEGAGRFYGTTGLDTCWTDVDRQTPLEGGDERFTVSGTLYCIAPLGEVNGDASVSIPELRFSGLIDWNAS